MSRELVEVYGCPSLPYVRENLPSPCSSSLNSVYGPPSSSLQEVFYSSYVWQKGLVSRHSQVNRKVQMQAMAMEVHYKLGAGMGVYLGLDLMGEMSPQCRIHP